jgi:hypothetical protein
VRFAVSNSRGPLRCLTWQASHTPALQRGRHRALPRVGVGLVMPGGLDARRQAKMAELMLQQGDSALTEAERQKYSEANTPSRRSSIKASDDTDFVNTPSSPRARYRGEDLPANTTRCWACGTALRDPGADYFACGACGALIGEEPKLPRQSGVPLWRFVAQHTRLSVALVSLAAVAVCVQTVRALLPPLTDASATGGAVLRHGLLLAYLASGVVLNAAAIVLAGPGHVTEELCPLLRTGGSADVESGSLRATTLDGLRADEGDMPLRGWRSQTMIEPHHP